MKKSLLLLAIYFSALPLHTAQATELTPQGNKEALKIFQNYVKNSPGCDPSLPGKKLLLTGFGLFQSISLNSAGAIVTNIADPQVWPADIKINQRIQLAEGTALHNGKFLTDQGAQVLQRTMRMEGTQVNLCVLVLDVLWDSAGAILAYEMNRFDPEAVLMLGGGGGPILEGGALNYAEFIPGYYANGKEAANNIPIAPPILPLGSQFQELPMRWNNQKIREAVAPLLAETKLYLDHAPGARPGNTYLCNHVSYVALAAAEGMPIRLAGGLIQLEPKLTRNPRVGFFHLPWGIPLEKQKIEDWGAVVLSVLHFMQK